MHRCLLPLRVEAISGSRPTILASLIATSIFPAEGVGDNGGDAAVAHSAEVMGLTETAEPR